VLNIEAALRVCARQPAAAVVPAARLQVAARHGWSRVEGRIWAWPSPESPLAIAWAGPNLIPVIPNTLSAKEQELAIAAFASRAKEWGQKCSSITGPSRSVLALWRALQQSWPTPREIRTPQPLLALTQPIGASTANATGVSKIAQMNNRWLARLTKPQELPLLLPASIAMFTEEVGYSPTRFGLAPYRDHLKTLIAEQRSYCLTENNQIIYKAEVAAVAGGVAQLQGVWVAPAYRGQGIAKPALVSTIVDIQKRIAPIVSLYVNQYNNRALHIYRSLGFSQIGEFATILF